MPWSCKDKFWIISMLGGYCALKGLIFDNFHCVGCGGLEKTDFE